MYWKWGYSRRNSKEKRRLWELKGWWVRAVTGSWAKSWWEDSDMEKKHNKTKPPDAVECSKLSLKKHRADLILLRFLWAPWHGLPLVWEWQHAIKSCTVSTTDSQHTDPLGMQTHGNSIWRLRSSERLKRLRVLRGLEWSSIYSVCHQPGRHRAPLQCLLAPLASTQEWN